MRSISPTRSMMVSMGRSTYWLASMLKVSAPIASKKMTKIVIRMPYMAVSRMPCRRSYTPVVVNVVALASLPMRS